MTTSTSQLLQLCVLLGVVVLLPIIPAYVLYKTLPSRTVVSGPFKGLNIQLTGAFGGYFLVLLVVVGLVSFQQKPARYEVWSITGKAVLKNGGPQEQLVHNDFSVQPPTTALYPDGRFTLDVPVKLSQDGNLEFPIIVIGHNRYQSQTIPLGDQQPTFGGKTYKFQSDNEAKKRIIESLIELEPLPDQGRP